MVQRYEVRGSEIGSGADYVKLELKLRRLAKQVIDSPCDWKTDELAREILDL